MKLLYVKRSLLNEGIAISNVVVAKRQSCEMLYVKRSFLNEGITISNVVGQQSCEIALCQKDLSEEM